MFCPFRIWTFSREFHHNSFSSVSPKPKATWPSFSLCLISCNFASWNSFGYICFSKNHLCDHQL
jgi:hypothetical protein